MSCHRFYRKYKNNYVEWERWDHRLPYVNTYYCFGYTPLETVVKEASERNRNSAVIKIKKNVLSEFHDIYWMSHVYFVSSVDITKEKKETLKSICPRCKEYVIPIGDQILLQTVYNMAGEEGLEEILTHWGFQKESNTSYLLVDIANK